MRLSAFHHNVSPNLLIPSFQSFDSLSGACYYASYVGALSALGSRNKEIRVSVFARNYYYLFIKPEGPA